MATPYDGAIRWLVVNTHPVWHTGAEVADDIRARLISVGADADTVAAGVALAVQCHRESVSTYLRAGGR